MDAEELLGAGRLVLRKRAPYFRAALLALVPVPVEGLGTIGVTEHGALVYDPRWLERHDAESVGGLLAHEVMHVLHRHGPERRGARDHRAWNVACDLAINPSLIEMGFRLPQGDDKGVFPGDKGWPEGETAEQYYARLQQEAQSSAASGEAGEDGKPSPCCGSGAGNALPGEPGAEQGRTKATLERVARSVAEAVAQHAKSRGRMPAGLERWATEMLQPPKVPWQAVLARTLRAQVDCRAGAAVFRYDGPSRRQAALGTGPGKPLLPRLRQPTPRVALVADTSGSMSADDLGLALREARGVLRAVGAQLTFVACDSDVHGGVQQVSSAEDVARRLRGGGGSSFVPAFAALERARPRPEIVVLATDGDIAVPQQAPDWADVVWLLVGRGRIKPCGWGKVVEVD